MRRQRYLWIGIIIAAIAIVIPTWVVNDFFAAAQGTRVKYGETITGEIDAANPADNWIFDGTRGDVITIRLRRLEGDLLPVISLSDPDGKLLLSLDWPQVGLPDIVLTASIRSTGPHTLSVAGTANSTGNYELDLALLEAGELEENVLAYGRVVSGELSDSVFQEIWTFRGISGDVVDITMTATSGDLDTFLSLVSPQGEVLSTSDQGSTGTDAALYAVTLPSSGNYSVVARRSGDRVGEGGTTTGGYDLALTLRNSAGATAITATRLVQGIETRGRLNASAPTALFSIEAEGVLTLALDAINPAQIGTVSVLTTNRVLLSTFSGVGAACGSVTLPTPGVYFVEVAAASVREAVPVDFSLIVDQLTTVQRASQPLQYNRPQTIISRSDQPEAWHFYGQTGDLISVELIPFNPTIEDSTLQILNPAGNVLATRAVRDKTTQALQLTTTGQYEILLDSIALQEGYQIAIFQHGINRIAFDQYAEPQSQGQLQIGVNQAVNSTLPLGVTHAWEIDAATAGNWRFQLSQTGSDVPVAIAVEDITGDKLGVSITKRLSNRTTMLVTLPNPGRYRVLVFDPTGAVSHPYMLWGGPTSTGQIPLNTQVKSVLGVDISTIDRWQLTVPADSLLNVDVTAAPGDVVPSVYVIRPDGQIVASNLPSATGNTALLGIPIEHGGQFELVIIQPNDDERLIYWVQAGIVQPFASDAITPAPIAHPVSEVYATMAQSAMPENRIAIAKQLTPSIRPDAEFVSRAEIISLEDLIPGEIPSGQRYQVWQFSANTNQMIGFSVVALEGQSNPGIVILNNEGEILAENYQTQSSTNYLTYRFASFGSYKVVVALNDGGRYTLLLNSLPGVDETLRTVLDAQMLYYGETVKGELNHADDQRVYVFYGRAGDSIAAQAMRTQGNLALHLDLLQSDNQNLTGADAGSEVPLAAITDYVLSADGIYQLVVTHGENRTNARGRFAIYLGVTATTTPVRQNRQLEEPAIVNLSGDQAHRWLFSAQSGETVDVKVEPISVNGPAPLTLQIADTAGVPFLQKTADLGQGTLAFENVLLPHAGVYQAVVSGGGRNSGVYRISLSRDNSYTQDNELAIRYGETTGKVITQTNFLDVWTFAGSEGDVVSLTVRAVRGDPVSLNVQLRAANGASLAAASGSENGITRLEQVILPFDSHYSIIIGNINGAFDGETAYEVTLRLEDTSARSIGSIITYGQIAEGYFYLDDRTDTWVFNGEQGDIVAATLKNSSPDLQSTIELVSTDWRAASAAGEALVLASNQALGEQPTTLQFELPLAGTYALNVNDATFSGGTYTLTLDNLTPMTGLAGSIRYDQTRNGQISALHLVDRWSFDGAFGDQITVNTLPDSRSLFAPIVTLLGPTGQPLISRSAPSGELAQINAYMLPETGRYTLEITRYLAEDGNTEGRYAVELLKVAVVDLNYPATAYNQIQRELLNANDPVDSWTINAEAGDVVRVLAEATSGNLDIMLQVYGENGRKLAFNDDARGLNAELFVEIPETGRYFIDVLRYGVEQGKTSGNYSLLVERVYRPAAQDLSEHVITYGDRVSGSVDTTQRSDVWAFSGEAGDTLRAKIQFPRDDSPLALYLVDPAGDILATGERIVGDSIIESLVLPYSGSYALEVRRPGDARAEFSPYALDLTLLATAGGVHSQQGSFVLPGQSLTGIFAQVPTTHNWQFTGAVGRPISLTLNRISGSLPQQITITAPNGTPVFFVNTPPGSANAFSTGALELPLDGIYTISISGDEQAIGARYRLSLREEAGIVSGNHVLTPIQDGFGLIANDRPAERWTFSAEAGDAITLRMATTAGNLKPTLMLWGPDNRPLVEGLQIHRGGYEQVLINRFVAPLLGEYQVVVGREGGNLGTTSGEYRIMFRQENISMQAAVARDVAAGTQILDYAAGNAPAYYAVQGLAGDVLAISARITNGGPVPDLVVETEAGEQLDVPVQVTETEVFVPALVLPRDGRYIIALTSPETVGYAFSVANRTINLADDMPTRNLGRGRIFSEGVINPAQPTVWLLPAAAGEVLIFTVDTSGGGLRADVTLYGPNGYIANAVETPGPAVQLGPIRLPDNGDYRLVVGSWLGFPGGSTGDYSVRVDPADVGISGSEGGHIAVRDQVVTGGFTAEDTQDIWTFDGKAGEVVTIWAERSGGEGSLSLQLSPTETRSEPGTGYPGAEITEIMLPDTGRYTIQVDGRLVGNTPIEYRLAVLRVQRSLIAGLPVAQGITWGQDFAGLLQDGESSDAWVFFGEAGDRIAFVVTTDDNTFLPEVYLLEPDNTILAADASRVPGSAVGQANVLLLSSGFYGLIVSGEHETDARYLVRIDKVTPSVGMGAELGEQNGGSGIGHLSVTAPVEHWVLRPEYGGTYILDVESFTAGATLGVFVQNAAGDIISEVPETGTAARPIVRLDAGQSYIALVSGGPLTVDTRYQIHLVPASSFVRSQLLTLGVSDVGRIDAYLLNNEWRLIGQTDQVWNISVTRTDGNFIPQVTIVDPTGTVLQESIADENGNLAVTFQVPVEGQYAIEVTRARPEGYTGDYTLIVEVG